jgi:hypothetical protein
MKRVLYCLVTILLLASCWKKEREEILGYAPIYGNQTEMKTISLTAPTAIENGGKIYVYDHTLYQIESGKGIHISDISNPASPVKLGFLKVPCAQELAVKDSLIFTNNMKDLVIVKIENNTAKTIRRLPDTFKYLFNTVLPPERGKFECIDYTKGEIIGWQKKKLINPHCYY